MVTRSIINDNPLYENFVTPNLCLHLKSAGLTDATNYNWIILDDKVDLDTQLFDADGYYKNVKHFLNQLSAPLILPAYSIKDIEKCLPFWFMTRDSAGYEISLEKIFELESKKALRMPDAMAMLLLEAIRKGIVSLDVINYKITYQCTQNARF